MTAIAFAITALENGRALGSAVLSAEARYLSVLWRGTDRLDRRFVPARQWLHVERALAEKLEPGPLPTDHAVVVALLPPDKRSGHVVQYLYQSPIVDGLDVARELDALLMSLAPPSLRLRQE